MIEATDLTKSYGAIQAVAGVSFNIAAGEVFGLLGPNGAGKSTTIGMLVGAVTPDSGSVTIADYGAPTSTRARQQIGLAPQALAIYEDLTAAENLQFYGALYGLSGAHAAERVKWCLDFAGLADRAKDKVETYSGGMKRRLNMAAALVHEPKIVLFDEPTVGVDPQSRNYIFESIEKLKADGLTVLYTTHYMEEAQRLCDRVAIMDAGKILALDTVPGLIGQFGGDSVLSAEIIGAPPELHSRLEGDTLTVYTREPMKELAGLTDSGVKFSSLRIDQPDLESVFLSLTGRSLRD